MGTLCDPVGATTIARAGGSSVLVLEPMAKHGLGGEDGEMLSGACGPANVLFAGWFDIRCFPRPPSRLYVLFFPLGTSMRPSLSPLPLHSSATPVCVGIGWMPAIVFIGRVADEAMVTVLTVP